ncbi:MAG: hypothetical protein NTZ97_00590 [Candidatus Moranbacteria bacterium]|nr:hypothetical protein [Candidatus Moranbacteria bacterium]
MDNFGKQFQKDDEKSRIRFSQSGIRFKTICHKCNNKLHDYDRKLAEFSHSIHNELIKNLSNPQFNEVEIDCYPNAVMRSILGHLLSAKIETDNVVIDKSIRSFIFDDSKSISEKVNVYYWFYPYVNVKIARDFVRMFSDKQFGFNSVIKFPPVGYLITDVPNIRGLENLNDFKSKKPNYKTKIKLMLRPFNQEDWPEGVADNYNPFIAFGKSFCNSLVAKPKK